ncbi:hypothetical protein [Mesorhizobium loti]|uniref:hypothetical protein n=1 Tax=Rhizobium loti TaxID=381 RepID=UPI00041359CA|nr:hypothetical protein [Mesorhizobium loti]
MHATLKSVYHLLLSHRRVGQLIGAALMAGVVTPTIADEPRHLDAQAVMTLKEARTLCAAALVESGVRCTVGKFGRVGAVAGHKFSYARYNLEPAPGDQIQTLPYSRVIVFESATRAMLRPILISSDDAAFEYDRPEILRSAGRIVLHIPAAEDGTGFFNRELLYVWEKGGWHDVDVTSWLDEIQHRLSPGLGALKGIFPNYATMKAGTPIWHAVADSNPCPTAGHADISLAWSGDRIVLTSLHINTSKKALNDQGCFE